VSTFYVRTALEKVGFRVREDLRHNMDRELMYRVCKAFPIGLVNEPLACFRIHPHSKSWSISNMINMAEEYSRIQAMFYTADEAENSKRHRIAMHLKAKGYLKFSKYTKQRWMGSKALLLALRASPRLAFGRSFLQAGLNLCGLLPLTKRFSQGKSSPALRTQSVQFES
jgi:hypothetical protein